MRKERRVREGDPSRRTISPEERILVTEMVREVEARIDKGIDRALLIAGVENPEAHREQHRMWTKLMPELEQTLIPWARDQHALTQERLRVWHTIKTEAVMWATRGGLLFLALSLFYGAKAAVEHMLR